MREKPDHDSPAVTQLLQQAAAGDQGAYSALFPHVYQRLKELARGRLQQERDGHTLNATALVHEAYLKLVDQTSVVWQSRAHFYAVASQAMRRILVDYARHRHRLKRGGSAEHVPWDGIEDTVVELSDDRLADVLALDDALDRLAAENGRAAAIVEYRFFGGLRHGEIAEVLGVSEVTVRRSWKFARLWLRRELGGEPREDRP